MADKYPTLAQRLKAAESDLRSTLEAFLYSVRENRLDALDRDLLQFLDGQAPQLVKEVARVKALRDAAECVRAHGGRVSP